jgi:hypothetical protein
LFPLRPADSLRPGADSDPAGYAIEPACNRRASADRTRLAGEDQERGLEGVVGIVGFPEHAPADTQHHRTMPSDQGCESGLTAPITSTQVPFQQVRVACRSNGPAIEERGKAVENGSEALAFHGSSPEDPVSVIVEARKGRDRFILLQK